MDCVFCAIVTGKIPTEFLYQDDEIVAFRDIHPAAPVHILIIPRRHIPSLAGMNEAEMPLIGRMAGVANRLAGGEGILEKGYRVVINSGKDGGQIVPHLHMHLLGGKRMPDALG